MTAKKTVNDPSPPGRAASSPKFSLRRVVPLAVVAVISVAIIAAGWHRQLSFETLARHYEALRDFIAMHRYLARLVSADIVRLWKGEMVRWECQEKWIRHTAGR